MYYTGISHDDYLSEEIRCSVLVHDQHHIKSYYITFWIYLSGFEVGIKRKAHLLRNCLDRNIWTLADVIFSCALQQATNLWGVMSRDSNSNLSRP